MYVPFFFSPLVGIQVVMVTAETAILGCKMILEMNICVIEQKEKLMSLTIMEDLTIVPLSGHCYKEKQASVLFTWIRRRVGLRETILFIIHSQIFSKLIQKELDRCTEEAWKPSCYPFAVESWSTITTVLAEKLQRLSSSFYLPSIWFAVTSFQRRFQQV